MRAVHPYACVTGLGFICSIGNERSAVLSSLEKLASGIQPHRFLGAVDQSNIRVAGVVQDFDFSAASWAGWTYPAGYNVPRDLIRSLPPHGVYAFCAVEQALSEAGLSHSDFSSDRIGLFASSAGSPMLMYKYLDQLHSSKGRRGNPMGIVSTISGTLNFNLAAHYRVTGANVGFVSACASSGHAIGYALDEIRLGRQDAVMVVGAEDFTAESMLPFSAMNVLSQGTDSTASRPWDASRDGFVPTGGACALLLESPQQAARRGAQVLARLIGWGQSSDGTDRTSSHPEGKGLRRAMANALADAALKPEDIDYINAHATSTRVGDISEAKAIASLFPASGQHPPVSSTKALTGHGLSMAGAMEAAFCSLFLQHAFYAGNAHLNAVDPDCAGINLPTRSVKTPLRHILSNSSGFGGANVSLVLAAS